MNEARPAVRRPEKEILADLVRRTRSYRRFRQDQPMSREALVEMIEAARLAGSARNLQPLKYILIDSPDQCSLVFPHLGWAGYLDQWQGPEEGERPAAYIVCLLDTSLADEAAVDLGIASQNILLTASAMGYGGCRIASISQRLAAELHLPDYLKVELVIALGVPQETVILTPLPANRDVRYWRDTSKNHYVPKRHCNEIIVDLS